ncbi:30S ribosomal protein S10 [Mycoplasma zalophi]|uniref:Small ribosomal subunit protein uS10 n=2 Tax=Mycoplasma zalophi TaxID=191287 RepID=A0ABS6DQE2_9MOLU|nr:30S ribosomal protein S10 [Mycoplasma zalophi]MBU4691325.1 30S ribosomal protein S10 [Mycoplasma zalophi]MBU4692551.1 30S ribosomal protein S10 [Mycoplasma zalophi]MCU4117303.1 30S ribosomal protein S10 [Mycoplasma zalophi]
MMKLNIKLKSFEHALVDNASVKIVTLANTDKDAVVSGPIPLPTKREIITILRSVHVNKKSREQFESRTHKRLIIIDNVSEKLLDQFKRIELPAGVQITINTVK